MVQYHIDTFSYLQHLAAKYGEYLLYFKDTLYFGKPNLGDDVVLRYGYDLKDFSFTMQTVPTQATFLTEEYHSNSTVSADSRMVSSRAKGYTAFASQQSEQLYPI